LTIVVPRRSWLEISGEKLGKAEKRKKEQRKKKRGKKEKEKRKKGKKEKRERVSKQPSSTAEIR
jgi:hypothetical protein